MDEACARIPKTPTFLLSALLAVSLMISESVHAAAIDCERDPADYQGETRRAAPSDMWRDARLLPIDGELPEQLQDALNDSMDRILTKVGGASIAVAIPGEGQWFSQRGRLTADHQQVPEGALFQAASVTKLFVAAVAYQLVAENKLSLQQRVDRWFPSVPLSSAMTIEQLLYHTHGLVSFNALPDFPDRYQTPSQLVALAASKPLLFCPGAYFAYSNTGYAMLGQVIEQLEGKPLHQVIADRITDPMRLEHTVLRHRGDQVSIVDGFQSGQPVTLKDGYATPYAAGGLASNAVDLVRFWHGYLSGKVVSVEAVKTQFNNLARLDQHGQQFYGGGVQYYDIPGDGPGRMLGHSGGIHGFTSVVAYIPGDNLFIAVLFNDQNVAAEAGLWGLLRAIRDYRAATKADQH